MTNQIKYHHWTQRVTGHQRMLHDPRVAIADHIGWQKPYLDFTEWRGLEPDNYNCAVLSDKPIDIPFLDEAVVYKYNRQWCTIFRLDHVEEEQAVIEYLMDKDYQAIWRNPRATDLRRKVVENDK
jgi:hypothetical protein